MSVFLSPGLKAKRGLEVPRRQEQISVLLHYTEHSEYLMEAEKRKVSISNLIRQKLNLKPFKHGREKQKAESVAST